MVCLDGDFLSRDATEFNLDISLPIRLQKRQLLDFLNFPKNKKLESCLAKDYQKFDSLLERYLRLESPFLIIVSEKTPRTTIPPLFIVKGVEFITWRDDKGVKKEISCAEMVKIVKQFEPSTWLEFAEYIWGSQTMAGRLLYVNQCEQVVELQKGITPSQLVTRNDYPMYSGPVSCFDFRIDDYRETLAILRGADFQKVLDFYSVKRIVNYLARNFAAFEKLSQISPMPTLEFGILEDQSFICIDVDWPAQWKSLMSVNKEEGGL